MHGKTESINSHSLHSYYFSGNLHLGGLRTALYNYIYSRSHKGKFILRIEDTDQTRLVPGTVEKLLEDLAWVGLNPDEGPNCGGSYGPYIQSERAKLYREEVETLLNTGSAYHCFCSERRLNILRKNALRNQEVPKYDNHCRSLPLEEVKKRLSSGQKSCIRLKLTSSEPFVDLVYGRTCHEVKDIEGDPVILKTDGFPTYHLANVIDDHHMQISHVIRGVEWLPSTNKHIMIYRALGYEPPKFVHLPLLLNSDGSKMSKRHGDLSVEVFRKKGLLPRALINFVVKAGSGFHTNSNDINHSLEELTNKVPKFDLSLINNNSCRLPLDRLAEFNHAELKRQINNDDELVLLVRKVREMIIKHFHNR
ncbi:hypothetical protein AAG570_000251 [Ranatra chinensis]|uniref:Nondiscriminating glutamyl-tRNA synthetase EARS2, mitochondrial n=1 Tax=Ranatra chinensis TaxID=642074 RepID=A0ABD0YWJ6_9HEMI